MDAFIEAFAASDAASLIDTFGESVEYRPFNGTARTILAVVDRNPIGKVPSMGPRDRPTVQVTVSTDPVTGIDPATIDFSRDRLYVQYVIGRPNDSLEGQEPDPPFRISKRIERHTPGVMDLLLT